MIIRYYQRFFRKAECDFCGALTKSPEKHTRYHLKRGEGQTKQSGTIRAFRDIEIDTCGHASDTGWCTTSGGPG